MTTYLTDQHTDVQMLSITVASLVAGPCRSTELASQCSLVVANLDCLHSFFGCEVRYPSTASSSTHAELLAVAETCVICTTKGTKFKGRLKEGPIEGLYRATH